MKKLLILWIVVTALTNGNAQIGMGTATPNAHAVLDLKSPGNNQGLLTPSMSTAQRNAISFTSKLGTDENGLLVYDTDDRRFYFWNGTQWDAILHGSGSTGTVSSIAAGTGLTGGQITSSGTIALANTNVAPGTYGSGTEVSQITVDSQGRITSATSMAITGAPPVGLAGGDLSGAFPNPIIGTGKVTSAAILDGTISNSDISTSAGIQDSKLATITAPGKVSGTAITSGTISGTTAVNISGNITTTGSFTASNTGGKGVQGSGTIGIFGAGIGNYSTGVSGTASGTGSYGIYSNGFAGGTTTWTSSSDRRFKKNIVTIQNGLEKILALRGVSYDWRNDEFPDKHFTTAHDIGVIAQEVKVVLPEVVAEDKDGYYSVSYEKIVPVLIEAIRQQQEQINQLQKQIAVLTPSGSGLTKSEKISP